MSKKGKIIAAILLVALIIVVVVYFLKKKSANSQETTQTTKSTSGLAGLNLGGIIGAFTGGGALSGKPPVQTSDYSEVAGTNGWANMDF